MSKKNISGLIKVFLLAVVGLALTPTIQNNIVGMTNATGGGNNLTGTPRILILLFPMFWVILMIAIPVAYVAVWLKGA